MKYSSELHLCDWWDLGEPRPQKATPQPASPRGSTISVRPQAIIARQQESLVSQERQLASQQREIQRLYDVVAASSNASVNTMALSTRFLFYNIAIEILYNQNNPPCF